MARILVVDDSAAVRKVIHDMVLALGHEAVEAEDHREGVRSYEQHRPDVVLLDINMPGRSGLETLRAIRAHDPQARVAMLTSVRDRESVIQAHQLGAKDYIAKPFSAERLKESFDKLLGPEPPREEPKAGV